jgi:hypothetical protein
MTLDQDSEKWRHTAELVFLWKILPEAQGNHLINALPQGEQDRFDAFLLTRQGPRKALKELETNTKHDEEWINDALIKKLERGKLEQLVKAGLEKGKILDNLSNMNMKELREVVHLCSYPKNYLVALLFFESLDDEAKKRLLA